ncbi:MAG: hypothetical protein Q8J88_00210 [Bacteroidales bacterium]|nr:hypothetical protein [Bacteroidales bacterium]
MKNKILLLLLAFIINSAVGQTTEFKDLILSVEKKPTNSQTSSIVILKFKPGKHLKIKTVDGRKLASTNYFLQDSATLLMRHFKALSNDFDTIALQDIVFIKGKVYGDSDRKLLGGVIALSSLPLGFFPVFATAWAGGPVFLVAMPFVGMFGAGVSMTGARRFNTTDKWDVKIIER